MKALGIASAVGLAIVGTLNAPSLQAQSTETFDVASVRRVEIKPGTYGVPVFFPTGGISTGRITYRATWLEGLIAEAFDVRPDQIIGPAWLKTERYDIVANIPTDTTPDQFRHMLGNLLVDRFRLRFHTGVTTRESYALRLAKSGPRVTPTRRRPDAPAPSGSIGAPDARGCPAVPPEFQGILGRPLPGEMCVTAQDVPMRDLARMLEGPAGRPVVDETGLTGGYDFTIRYESIRRGPDGPVSSDPAPTVFTAVEEQLGLKLESTTGSFPQFVIDSIDREPTEN